MGEGSSADLRRLLKQTDFSVAGIEAVDLKMLRGNVLLGTNMDRHVGFGLEQGQVAPLAVVQVGGDRH